MQCVIKKIMSETEMELRCVIKDRLMKYAFDFEALTTSSLVGTDLLPRFSKFLDITNNFL